MPFYKAVRLDRTSHYDSKTLWRVGGHVRVDNPDPPETGPCGVGIHCSPTLLDAVGWQGGPSRYYEVEPCAIISHDETKARCSGVRVVREIGRSEQDELAGFRLCEANHLCNPLLRTKTKRIDCEALLREWASVGASVWPSVRSSVRASVRDSVGASVRTSVRALVWASVGNSVRNSVRNSVGPSVRASVGASVRALVWASVRTSVGPSVRASVGASVRTSVWGYTGSLFPNIKAWRHVEAPGPNPWEPLRKLWLAGYVPSFDGLTWRLHAGKDAREVFALESS